MFEVIQGVPGSGKTYYAVKTLLDKRMSHNPRYYVITNIDGYKFADEHMGGTTGKEIADFLLARDWEKFSQEMAKKGMKIHISIDEAQRVYGSLGMERSQQKNLFFFLEFHRHWGMDITFITQARESLHKRVFPLLDQVHKVSKTTALGRQIIHTVDPLDSKIVMGQKAIRREKCVFESYKSAFVEYGFQKPSSPMKRYAVFLAIGVMVFLFFAYSFLGSMNSMADQSKSTTTLQTQSLKASTVSYQNNSPIENKSLIKSGHIWADERYPKIFNSDICIKSLNANAYYCKGITKQQSYINRAGMSYCKQYICDYYFTLPEEKELMSLDHLPNKAFEGVLTIPNQAF